MLALVLAALLCGAAQVSAKVATPHGGNALSEFFSDYEQTTIAKAPAVQELPPEPPLCYYDLASGRGVWLSPDPIGEAGGINLYAYVGNDPVNAWDPLGLRDVIAYDGQDDFPACQPAGPLFRRNARQMAEGDDIIINVRSPSHLAEILEMFADAGVSYNHLHILDHGPMPEAGSSNLNDDPDAVRRIGKAMARSGAKGATHYGCDSNLQETEMQEIADLLDKPLTGFWDNTRYESGGMFNKRTGRLRKRDLFNMKVWRKKK